MAKWEKIEDNKVKMEIEVPEDKVEEALSQAYKKVVKDVNLPGFRKGKVPRKVLEARFGPEIFYEDAAQILVPEGYREALEEESEIEPIDEPDIDVVQLEKGKPFIFTATVEVKPEVELGEYKGVPVEVEKEEIGEEDVERYIEGLRDQHSRLVVVEDEDVEVQEGDMVLLDFKGYLDGEPFEGGEAQDYSLEIGSGSLIEGFEEQLKGAKVGEEKEVTVTFPEEYQEESLAGKEAVFEVNVKEIKRKELPELNDDFAREVSEFDTFEEYRNDVFRKLQEEAENRNRTRLENTVIEEVSNRAELEIPDVLVEKEIDRIMSEMEQRISMQGINMDQFLEISGKTREELRSNYREEAVKRVKGNLVLDAIIKKEGFEVQESEIEEKLQEMAEAYNDDPERIRDILQKQGRMDMLKEESRMRKVIDFLVENAEVQYKAPGETEETGEAEEEAKEDEAEREAEEPAAGENDGENNKEAKDGGGKE